MARISWLCAVASVAVSVPAFSQVGSGITAGSDGRVHFIDLSRDRVWRWEPERGLITVAHGTYEDFAATGKDGTVFLINRALPVDMRWIVHTIGPEGAVDEVVRRSPVPISNALAIDSAGAIYFRRFTELIRLSTDGEAAAWARPVTMDRPGYGVFGDDATLYFVDGNAVKTARADEGVRTLAGSADAGFEDAVGDAARFFRPMGLAVDSTGTAYVADYGNQAIRRVAPDGTVSTVARIPWIWRPAGVAIDGNRIFVLERAGDYYGEWVLPLTMYSFVSDIVGTPRIRRLHPDGSMSTVATVRRLSTLIVLGLGLIAGFWGGILWLKRSVAPFS